MFTALLAGCGGGGGSSSSDGPAIEPVPGSGSFAWALRAQGSTSNLKYGISLVHPAATGTEYVIEPTTAAITDTRVVTIATVDGAAQKASGLRPFALLYITGGDVRVVPLDANGTSPKSRVLRSQTTSACQFLIDGNDYAAPGNSRYVLSTAGADGQCGTADDGRAELSFSAAGVPALTPLTDVPLDLARDVSTLAPRGWIYGKKAVFWSTSPATTVALRSDTDPAYSAVVVATARSALASDGQRMSVIDFSQGNAVATTPLDAGKTAGTGWQAIGYDADNFYAYRNTGNNTASTWTVLKVSRQAPSASVLASGTGLLSVASMGASRLYVTVIGASDNRLIAISKSGTPAAQTLESTASSILTTVQTSVSGVHQLFRVTNIGTTVVSYAIEMVDETGAKLYSTTVGGFTMATADPGTLNFNLSENRTRFVFVNGFGSRGFGDASLISYDTGTKAATVLGVLPGAADFGSDVVYANVIAGSGSFMAGFAARSAGGVISETGAKIFSLDVAAAGSIKLANVQR